MKTNNLMKKILLILLLILIKSFTYSQSINDFDNTQKLSSFELEGYEEHAIEKIKEYANYLEIISNKNYDKKLKESAIELTLDLFINKNSEIIFFEKDKLDKNRLKIEEYLDFFMNSEYDKITVEIETSWLNQKMTRFKDFYLAEVEFMQTNSYYKHDKIYSEETVIFKVDIYLKQIVKKFGDEQIKVWTIYLDDITQQKL